MADLVKCEICGELFGRITPSHLSKHGTTTESYRTTYPLSSLVSTSVLDICSVKKKEWHKNKIWTDNDRFKIGSGNRGKIFSDEYRKKLSDSHKNRNPVSESTRRKISNSKLDKPRSTELKERLRVFRSGKTYDDLYGIERANVIRRKLSNISAITGFQPGNMAFGGRTHTNETKRKMRLAAIKRLQNRVTTGFRPNYNKRACDYFNDLMIKTNTHIIHTENGGEFHIPSLGYWVDGYDKQNNIVYEVYERRHFRTRNVKKDMIRQLAIINELHCDFVIVREDELNVTTS